MAYDTKRLKTFKWLEKLANNSARYSKGAYNSISSILACYGRFYATNGIILAEVGVYGVRSYRRLRFHARLKICDSNGFLLEFPELAEPIRNYRSGMFTDIMNGDISYEAPFKVNPAVMTDALYPFKLYDIPAYQYMMGDMCMLSGHDNDISLRVLLAGMRGDAE